MQRKMNKKGFTIVELVIVIAVIAILAAVLIPTFASIIRKADVANDTAVAKNLNTAAISAQADTFDEALAAAKDSGYLIANLNATADKCYFVWEDDTNQFLLYDLKETKIIYSNTAVDGDPDESWCFAVNNPEDKQEVADVWSNVTFNTLIADIDDLEAILAAGGDIYFDESLVLDNNHLLEIDSTAVINLGNSSLNTSGIVDNGDYNEPIEIGANGNVIINGGNISAAGQALNLDNIKINVTLIAKEGSNLVINDTVFDNATYNSQMKLEGTVTLNNVVINATKTAFDTRYGALVTLNDVKINMLDSDFSDTYGAWVWSCNSTHGTNPDHDAKVIVNSGIYTREAMSSAKAQTAGGIMSCGGDVEINGGTFTAEDGKYFGFSGNGGGEIVIKGGTFGDKTFGNSDFTAEYLESLCVGDCVVTANADGSFTITQ